MYFYLLLMKTTLPLIPYVPSLDERTETIFKFITIKPGQKTLDLGAGDGRIVIAIGARCSPTHDEVLAHHVVPIDACRTLEQSR